MVVQDVWQYINDNLAPYAPLQMDGLAGAEDSISVQTEKGDTRSNVYLNGAVTGELFFSVRARSRDRRRASGWLEGVVDHFKANPRIRLSAACFFSAEPISNSFPYERGDNGCWVYTAPFKVIFDQLPIVIRR